MKGRGPAGSRVRASTAGWPPDRCRAPRCRWIAESKYIHPMRRRRHPGAIRPARGGLSPVEQLLQGRMRLRRSGAGAEFGRLEQRVARRPEPTRMLGGLGATSVSVPDQGWTEWEPPAPAPRKEAGMSTTAQGGQRACGRPRPRSRTSRRRGDRVRRRCGFRHAGHAEGPRRTAP